MSTINYEDLEPKEFIEKMETTQNFVLLDVRTPAEIAEISIDGHVALNIMDAGFTDKINELDKSKSYFIYCRSGNRSGQACKYMSTQGFTGLYNLKGGMLAWENEYC